MTDKKYNRIIIGGLLFSSVILIVLTQLTKASIQLQNRVLLWIFGFSIISAILVVYFNVVASFTSVKRKFPGWSSASSALLTALIIYFGFLIVSLSFYKELLRQMTWDPSMLALGIAVFAFGWSFVTQHFHDKKIDKIEEMIGKSQPPKTRGRKSKK
jgi:uncharacterized membrane protein YbhN (UPF0104 family)